MNQYFYEQFQRARSQSPSRERGGSVGSDQDEPLELSPRERERKISALGVASPTRALLSVLNRLPHRNTPIDNDRARSSKSA